MPRKSIKGGEIAYKAYCESIREEAAEFESFPIETRNAWIEVALAVIAAWESR